MATIRVEHNKNYTVMSNYHLRDKTISLKAKGLLSYMLSLPDDWDYSINSLCASCKEGVDAIRTTIKELEDNGYITRCRARKKDGTLGGTEYIVREHPYMEEPILENPTLDNPRQLSTNKNKILNKQKPPISPKGDCVGVSQAAYKPEWFQRFWMKYPKRRGDRPGRLQAIREWDKLSPSMELCKIMSTMLDEENWPEQWKIDDGQYIPMASKWLHNRMWEDCMDNEPVEKKKKRFTMSDEEFNRLWEEQYGKLSGTKSEEPREN